MSARAAPLTIFLVVGLAGCATLETAPERDTPAVPEPGSVEQLPDVDPPDPDSASPPVEKADPGPVKVLPESISVAAVGDMMIGTDFPRNTLPDDDGERFLEAVTPWLVKADIAIGNLEGVLVDGGKPAKDCASAQACYLFRSPTRYAAHYRDAGFDVLSLANNHARDFGEDGRSETMRTLRETGISHTGREGDFATVFVEGLQVAVLAFAVTQESNLVHDYERAEQTIGRFAKSHDLVIVSFHAGAEGQDVDHLAFDEEWYYGEPRGDVVRFSRMAVDAGADLVFGHGPHVVRAMELYKDRLIAYSLGNFATYYGISVRGLRGVAPILISELAADGRFLGGELVSTEQIRPAGPTPDASQRAMKRVRELSLADFVDPGLHFLPDGRLQPKAERTSLLPKRFQVDD